MRIFNRIYGAVSLICLGLGLLLWREGVDDWWTAALVGAGLGYLWSSSVKAQDRADD